ncbi:MAG: phosphoribosylglycinamide formyltransferase [Opitutaceae bacterium]|nr:phosphoribosylglycinamide formyltransferase [Opitutaceae bacterium]
MNIGFLASHNGSNMQAIINACKTGVLQASPVVVISNNAGSGALARAKQEGILSYRFSSKTHPDPAELDLAILDAMLEHQVDIIVLAGYMKKIGPKTLSHFSSRILNIHPSLLPKFGGKGMYGSRVHQAVIASGEKESGVSIHIVDAEYDTGPVIAQARVPVESVDTPEVLASRILQCEHTFFAETLQKIVTGEIVLPGPRANVPKNAVSDTDP